MKKQVNIEHYDFNKYVSKERWNSYYNQIGITIESQPKNVLIIGVGDNIVGEVLKKFGYVVTTFDFAEDVNPDIIGDVTIIDKIINKKYDVVICCQVLEHLPFEKFEDTIKRISKVVSKNGKFILSLPDARTYISFSFRLLGLKKYTFLKRIPVFWKRKFRFDIEGNNEHYWEVGIVDVPCKKIRDTLRKYFTLEKEFVDSGNLFHHFYILKNK